MEGEEAKLHRIRITLTSRNVKSLEKVARLLFSESFLCFFLRLFLQVLELLFLHVFRETALWQQGNRAEQTVAVLA